MKLLKLFFLCLAVNCIQAAEVKEKAESKKVIATMNVDKTAGNKYEWVVQVIEDNKKWYFVLVISKMHYIRFDTLCCVLFVDQERYECNVDYKSKPLYVCVAKALGLLPAEQKIENTKFSAECYEDGTFQITGTFDFNPWEEIKK